MTRLFGAREVALGVLTVTATGKARTGVVLVGIAVDLADAATGYLGPQEGVVPPATGTKLLGPAVAAVLAGLLGLRVKKVVAVS